VALPTASFFGRTCGRLRARPRLYIALAAGLAIGLLMPGDVKPTMRAIVGWDGVALVYLALVLQMVATATRESMRHRAALEDPARSVFLAIVSAAGLVSIFSILGIMRAAKAEGGSIALWLTVFAASTILLSWLLTHSVFAVHYAHRYYKDLLEKRQRGLDFPGEHDDPDYWDFLYFSFVIGMTAQVSDIQVMTRGWRRLVLAHSILSFLFNTVILALSINLLAGFF
jgi:uncharacterized membrane protein